MVFEDVFEGVKDFGAHTNSVGHAGGANGNNHILLKIGGPVGVCAAIDDIHHRHRKTKVIRGVGDGGNVLIKGKMLGICNRLGGGEGNGENSIGAKIGLIFGVVEVEHKLIDLGLVAGVIADKNIANFIIYVPDGLEDTFAAKALWVAVAKFEGFASTGRSTRRNGGTADMVIFK